MVEYCVCGHTKVCHYYHYKEDGKTKRPCLAWCPCPIFALNNLQLIEDLAKECKLI